MRPRALSPWRVTCIYKPCADALPKVVILNSSPSRLARRLNLMDAITLGLGSMIGAGIFAAAGPAAAAAGSGLLIAIVIAGAIAFLNATTMAQLAAIHPESGGTYVYGRKRLGNLWGFLAGWGFVIGKLASCAAMSLTFAHYTYPDFAKPMAIGAVLVLMLTNYLGIKKTASATKVLVTLVLIALGMVAFAALAGGAADLNRLSGWTEKGGFKGVLEASGLMFFAFAGYARIATLGEEVIEPQTTIPKAIVTALTITLVTYLIVIGSAVLTVNIESLADSKAPLVLAVESGPFHFLSPMVRIGACFASLGVLLSLMAGISRTIFSMSANADLPKFFSAVHAKNKVPHHAEFAVGVVVIGVVSFADLRGAIGFSSFSILLYYAIANVAGLTLKSQQRLWPRWMSAAGFVSCLVIALSLPLPSIIGGCVLFTVGAIVYGCLHFAERRKAI